MHSPNPVAFSFLGIDIMWYGILIATGFLLAILISYRRAHIFSISKDDIVNFALFMMPVSIVGARLYYVIFSWSLYKNNPVSIFYTRNGGLAIHGGLIAGIIVAAFFCRRRKIRLCIRLIHIPGLQTYPHILWKSYTIETTFSDEYHANQFEVFAQHSLWE